MSNTATSYSDRCKILSEFWQYFKDESEYQDYIEYNDVGLLLAFCIVHDIVKSTDDAARYINESFDLLLETVDVADVGYTSLDQIITY